MKYLLENQLQAYLRVDSSIEQFIGQISIEDHTCLRWIHISRTKSSYELRVHEVFDDRDVGVESIYDFSYYEPDDLYGKEIGSFDLLENALETAEQIYNADKNKYLTFGYMDEALKDFEINNIKL
jgi:hypothetical protein